MSWDSDSSVCSWRNTFHSKKPVAKKGLENALHVETSSIDQFHGCQLVSCCEMGGTFGLQKFLGFHGSIKVMQDPPKQMYFEG